MMGRWRVNHLGVFSRPSHKTRKWQLCQKLACHNLGDSSFTAGVNRPSSRCGSSGPAEEHYLFMVPTLEHKAQGTGGALGLPKVSELMKGRASCLKTATNIQMAVLPKVRIALCAASQLSGDGPTVA